MLKLWPTSEVYDSMLLTNNDVLGGGGGGALSMCLSSDLYVFLELDGVVR